MHIYNCHTHVFNLDCAPDRFLNGIGRGWFGKAGARLLQLILAFPLAKNWTLRLANRFPFARKYAAFLNIGSDLSPLIIFEKHLLPAYPAGTRFVVLPINFDLMGAGTATLNQESQLWQLLDLRRRYPNTCLPFVSIDPRRGSAAENLAFLLRWVERGFVGIKLYPGLGFYPFDERLDLVYQYAEAHGLPIMTHCTRGGIFYRGPITDDLRSPARPDGLRELYGLPYPLRITTVKETNDNFCDFFLDPRAYELVLARFPNLKICLAHYGGSSEIDQSTAANLPTTAPENWYESIRWLMMRYPHVYTDVSFTLAEKRLFTRLAADLAADSPFRERILFGTDFFMTTQVKNEAKLAVELMEHLVSEINAPDAWWQLANSNPVRYLQSSVYTPIELFGQLNPYQPSGSLQMGTA
ncbi:amidohydrolase family protein [Hymenobacter sp. BT186]|uniref:Amidohydrolase family protein n=1 Tax=Hymenobacter telluris TaxID=2816474 RepID=A0A939JF72_9BACT|nr:amidohydrolase family protein [Hymenobacter telluris]MBO0360703.1 amidohydrolase family protein [Hymenobacter telluris]MBW3376730.1 amidohydrolase family protein [Hymenobacter norwichensis]